MTAEGEGLVCCVAGACGRAACVTSMKRASAGRSAVQMLFLCAKFSVGFGFAPARAGAFWPCSAARARCYLKGGVATATTAYRWRERASRCLVKTVERSDALGERAT